MGRLLKDVVPEPRDDPGVSRQGQEQARLLRIGLKRGGPPMCSVERFAVCETVQAISFLETDAAWTRGHTPVYPSQRGRWPQPKS